MQIAAAAYLHQADNDGEWSELWFNFENGAAETARPAERDTAIRTIHPGASAAKCYTSTLTAAFTAAVSGTAYFAFCFVLPAQTGQPHLSFPVLE